MPRRKKKKCQKRSKKQDSHLLRNFVVLLVFTLMLGFGTFYWYRKQEQKTQKQVQEQVLVVLDFLHDFRKTPKQYKWTIEWLIDQIPASKGLVIEVRSLAGSKQYAYGGVPAGGLPVRLLENTGYLVGYSELYKNPARG